MKKEFLSLMISILINVQADENYDLFIMNEANIREYRFTEDTNAGYPPLFMECTVLKEDESSCQPAIPILNENDGHVSFGWNHRTNIYYGCSYKTHSSRVLNAQALEKKVVLQRASRTYFPTSGHPPAPSWFTADVDSYKYACATEISPTLWRRENQPEGSYHIGFKFINHDPYPLAKIEFDHDKKIPLRTLHFLHGGSLGVPVAASNTLEEIIFEEDSNVHRVNDLKKAFSSYYTFKFNYYPKNGITETTEISMAHLIPEYDMVQTGWKKIAYFAQTIVPMWTELYLGVWADVEEMIREVAFKDQQTMSIYSGTHGQLTYDKVNLKGKKFFLSENGVAFPELIWKLLINEKSHGNNYADAIVIILHNVTDNLKNSNIFTQLEAPCESKCGLFKWRYIDNKNLFCCTVNEVKDNINEFPEYVKHEDYDVLLYSAKD